MVNLEYLSWKAVMMATFLKILMQIRHDIELLILLKVITVMTKVAVVMTSEFPAVMEFWKSLDFEVDCCKLGKILKI